MSEKNAREKYRDIIDLPRHVSKKYPQMPVSDRAAQFSPFAALTGHDAALKEIARTTEQKIILDEGEISVINKKLCFLRDLEYPEVSVRIEYFEADEKKSGGKYVTCLSVIKRIDEAEGRVVLHSGKSISICEISALEGDIFSYIND